METATSERPSLSARLRAVADLVRRGAPVADVGADHGLLGVALLREGLVPRVLALDLRPAPLAAAASLARRHGLEDGHRLELRLSDGLAALRPGEVETVVIAGMGGALIRRLLERAPLLAAHGAPARLVLQPNLDAWRVRAWALAKRWTIVDERLITDAGRHYPVIGLERTEVEQRWDEADLRWGPLVRRRHGRALDAALAEEEARHEELVARLSPSKSRHLALALETIRAERARLATAADPEQTR